MHVNCPTRLCIAIWNFVPYWFLRIMTKLLATKYTYQFKHVSKHLKYIFFNYNAYLKSSKLQIMNHLSTCP